MLIAVEYLSSVGTGVTSPHFFRANDGKIYIVKLQNNPLSIKVLVSELLAAKIGETMQLCFPYGSIIEITEQLLYNTPALLALDVSPGQHFASQYVYHSQYIDRRILCEVINISEMAGIMLFDHIFHNADRTSNRRNLLIQQENDKYKIVAIDNSHLFKSGKWTLESLNRLACKISIYYHRSFGLLLREYLKPQDFIPYIKRIEKISDNCINSIIEEIPQKWLPDDCERLALADYIKTRRDMLNEIYRVLCNQIPKNRGGSRRLNPRIISLIHTRSSPSNSGFNRQIT